MIALWSSLNTPQSSLTGLRPYNQFNLSQSRVGGAFGLILLLFFFAEF